MKHDESAGDGEAKTGATTAQTFASRLLVLLKDQQAILFADAGAGVAHAEDDEAGRTNALAADTDDDFAVLRELDGVVDEIAEHLANATSVNARDEWLAFDAYAEALLADEPAGFFDD